jgi:hypothetical protein
MRFPVTVILSALAVHAAQLSVPYSVTVVAGSNAVGDGALATSASLLDAPGVAVDVSGHIYVADAGDNRVRMIAPGGIITTFLGGLNSPYGVAADAKGNVYVADLGNNRIQKVALDGTVTTLLGQLASPRNVLADSAGNVYFSEFAGHRVSRISPNGSVTVIAGTGVAGFSGDGSSASSAQLRYPAGLALDTAGNIYIADSGNNAIRKVSGGKITTVLGTVGAGALSTPTSVAVDAAGNLYVADTGNQRIRKLTLPVTISTIPVAAKDLAFDSAGNLLAAGGAHVYRIFTSGAITTIAGDGAYWYRGDGGPATSARLHSPSGLALDANGNLWVADTANGRVRIVTPAGQISTVLGGNGQLNSPLGLALDASGDLFIADAAGYRVREIVGVQGTLLTVAGTGAPGLGGEGLLASASALNAPNGIAIAAGGVVYVADTGNHRVRRINSAGGITTVAGNGFPGFNGDGPGQGVQLSSPSSVCGDATGNLYIADTGNNRIRKQTPDGMVTTILGPSQLSAPRGVAVDASGNVWIADTGNQRVVAWTPAGMIVVASQLQAPVGLAIDPVSGSIYVADAGANLVLKLVPGPPLLTEVATPVAVVNAATLMPGPVAPGSLLSIFGSGLANAQVLFDGQSVPLVMAQDTQVNVQIPPAATGAVSVVVGGTVLLNAALSIVPSAPGIFTVPGGTGPAGAANQDGTVNSDANPAVQGSVVTFYATGIGVGAVSVQIGGAAAQVLYAGNAPGFVGVSQIDATVPSGLSSGALALSVQAGSAQSQPGVTIAVQ